MLKLEPDQIHLWLVFFDEIRDEHLLDQYRRLLTDEEQDQEKRFHFEKDQRRYLVTRALVRTVLSRYAPIAPKQWSFSTNAYGKPTIDNDDLTAQKISFNISHTQGLIILGVTDGKALGVDTENVHTRPAPLEIGGHFFSRDEVAALDKLPAEIRHDRFFQYWTLKEAYIKARGMGLSIPLDQFGFYFPQDAHIELSIHPRLNDLPSRWRFWQFRPSPNFLAAVCAERSSGLNQKLVITKIVPFGMEEVFDCGLFRESI